MFAIFVIKLLFLWQVNVKAKKYSGVAGARFIAKQIHVEDFVYWNNLANKNAWIVFRVWSLYMYFYKVLPVYEYIL